MTTKADLMTTEYIERLFGRLPDICTIFFHTPGGSIGGQEVSRINLKRFFQSGAKQFLRDTGKFELFRFHYWANQAAGIAVFEQT